MRHLDDDFTFSQSSLQDYVDCPKRFWLRYMERIKYPAPNVDEMLDFEARMADGEAFHRLVHQHLAGIPADLLNKHVPTMRVGRWLATYLEKGLLDVPERRYAEQVLRVGLGRHGLMAKFDLIALSDEEVLIVDWKTSPYMPKRDKLAHRLQTIVYRYVLVKGGMALNGGRAVAPEQVTMRYWYVNQDGEQIEFTYDKTQFEADEAYLSGLVEAIEGRKVFEATDDTRLCRFCVYRGLCERGIQAGSLADWEGDDSGGDAWDFDVDFEQIGEVIF